MKPAIIGSEGRVGKWVQRELGSDTMRHGLCFDKANKDAWPDSFEGMTVFLCVPGTVRNDVLRRVLGHTPKAVVDVTFCSHPYAKPPGVRVCCPILIDAGFAPGLANVLAWDLANKVGGGELSIHVGGMPADKNINRWHHAVSWNANDHLDEYVRHPVWIKDGQPVSSYSPLEDEVGPLTIGEFEGMKTDGLRTLIRSAPGLGYTRAEEWTLRWPGFYGKLRRQEALGRRLTALAREWHESETTGFRERVVLKVYAANPSAGKSGEWNLDITEHDAMARVTAAAMVAFADALTIANLEPGVFTPELLAEIEPSTLALMKATFRDLRCTNDPQ